MYSDKNLNSIVFVTPSLRGGGAERVLLLLANYFAAIGIKVDIVFSMRCDQKPAYYIDDRITVHRIPAQILSANTNIVGGKINSLRIVKHLRETFKKIECDVIISFLDKTNIYSIVSNIGLNIPLIVSERSSYNFLRNNYWRLIRRLLYPLSDGLVVLSKYDYDKYQFVQNRKVIFNPIAFSEKYSGAPRESSADRENIILAVGSLNKVKGFDILLQSLSDISLDNWKVIILGEGPERANLERQIKLSSLEDKVFLLGRKSDVETYYKKSSIFVLSSRIEGFPNVLAEAMFFGCACIAFDCKTGPSDMIENNVNGILVEPGNVKSLARKLTYLMNDPGKISEFSDRSIDIEKKLSLDQIASSWLCYIEEIRSES